ncbi:hypothetical protein N7471_012511 [Penicillium samsonianum]|uniref:uncharacterized protein n=1 Tax=Penicillium samsonianum TaxID=1882272 RepID=UPI002548314D|nr:uncharacterized protein N7471_012511 [Penicillium samsonianum]KAJ6125194.1 hypothetical protein N7471_012511 [Penicillium samsonianum]
MSLGFCSVWKPVWLRICYDPTLVEKYEEMKKSAWVPGGGVPGDCILDDEMLYAFEDGTPDSWRKVLVRMPGITDFQGARDYSGDDSDIQYSSGQNDEVILAEIEEEEDEDTKFLSKLSVQVQTTVYLLDREAITTGLIKVLWVNEHGQTLWENRVEASTLTGLSMAQEDSCGLAEIVGYRAVRGALIVR